MLFYQKKENDQDESKIRNRFNEYENKTAVLKHYYKDQKKYYGISGVGSIEEITVRICEVFDKLQKNISALTRIFKLHLNFNL